MGDIADGYIDEIDDWGASPDPPPAQPEGERWSITDEACAAAIKAERSQRWHSDELRVWAMLAAASEHVEPASADHLREQLRVAVEGLTKAERDNFPQGKPRTNEGYWDFYHDAMRVRDRLRDTLAPKEPSDGDG